MNKFRKEEGLTLIELLIVIALVAIVAAIALPILLNVLSGAKSSATSDTNTAVTNFVRDWSSAGYDIAINNAGVVYALGDTANGTATATGVPIAQIADPNGVATASLITADGGVNVDYTA